MARKTKKSEPHIFDCSFCEHFHNIPTSKRRIEGERTKVIRYCDFVKSYITESSIACDNFKPSTNIYCLKNNARMHIDACNNRIKNKICRRCIYESDIIEAIRLREKNK